MFSDIIKGMANQPLEPRMAALLDDACWMIYRLFGVSARIRLPGLDTRDRPWEFQVPWVCHFIHTGEAWNPSNPDPNWKSGCHLTESTAPLPPGQKRAPCLSGLVHTSIPVHIGKSGTGTLTLGPFLTHPPSETGFKDLCRRLKTTQWAHMRWAYMQSPHISAKQEKELLAFSTALFKRILDSSDRNAPGHMTGTIPYEYAYPPMRLADDFPLHIYGVFVNFGEMLPGTEKGAPSEICRLEYVENGKCSVGMNGRTFELSQGQFLIILPGDQAVMEPVDKAGKCERLSISFHATASLLADIAGKPLNSDPFQLTLLSRITDLAAAATDASHRDSEVKVILAHLLFTIRRNLSSATEPAQPSISSQPIRYGATVRDMKRLLDESGARMSLADIARQLHITVPTLRRQFKQQTGITPVTYRRQQQIIKARLLLRSGNQSVSEVARRLGFCSIHYFSGVFRKLTGMSPRAYTRSLMSTDRQTEEAEIRLREHLEKPSAVAQKLGYDSPHAFAQAFRQRTGVSPRNFGKVAGKKGG
jgi:AraC-like DNA-binding protein